MIFIRKSNKSQYNPKMIPDSPTFWHVMRIVMILAIVIGMASILLYIFSNPLKLSMRARLGLRVAMSITGLVVAGFSYGLKRMDPLAFQAVIFWPLITFLVRTLFLVGVVSFIHWIGSFIVPSLREFRGFSGIAFGLTIVSFVILLPNVLSVPSPYYHIVDSYNHGIEAVISNDMARARVELKSYAHHAWLLKDYRVIPWYKEDPYIDDANNLLACIDGGSLTLADVSHFASTGGPVAISYVIKPQDAEAYHINIFSDGRIYYMRNEGNLVAHYGVAPYSYGGFKEPFYLYAYDDLKPLIPDSETSEIIVKYQCPDCYKSVIDAYINDPAFAKSASIRVSRPGSMDYYNICCDGKQVNGYWCPFQIEYAPPWTGFREAVFHAAEEALSKGEVISNETYLDELEQAEEQYKFKSLTDYEWTKLYLVEQPPPSFP
jgi:hypothetical protein